MQPYRVLPGDAFAPRDMLALYKEIPVQCGGQAITVSIDMYRNERNGAQEKGGCSESVPLRLCVQAVAPGTISRAGGGKEWYWVFGGKGSPWAIASVLEDLYNYSEQFIAVWEHPNTAAAPTNKEWPGACAAGRKVAALLKDPNVGWEQTMQKICDGWFGLDCNGFVGNWARMIKPDSRIDPEWTSKLIMDLTDPGYREEISEIEYWDICAYADNKHIMAIDKALGGDNFNICQSAGGGPRRNQYMIEKVADWQFRLKNPQDGDYYSPFYVISLW